MSSDAESEPFERVWESFLQSPTTYDGRHDTQQWRAHAGPFAACIFRVPDQSVEPSLADLRRELAAIDGVRLHPDGFLHVMLQELGFVVDHPTRTDEVSVARLEEFAQAAAEPISRIDPFEIFIGGANAFLDAVFLEVRPAKPVNQIHHRLFDLAARSHVPSYPYLPHCTVAHFDGTVSPHAVSSLLQSWRDNFAGEFLASEVEIVTIDNQQTYPELEPYAIIPLNS